MAKTEKSTDFSRLLILAITFAEREEPRTFHPALLIDDRECILVDCGYPGALPLLEEATASRGLPFHAVTGIVITHHDYDHVGALSEILDKYPHICSMASEADAPYIEGKKKSLRLAQAEALYQTFTEAERPAAEAFQSALAQVAPARIDRQLHDGDLFPWCGGTEIVATPGHMPGHISLYLRQWKTLITGDALIAINGRLRIASPHYAMDLAEARRSVKKLLDYDIERFVCYHGGEVETNLSHRRHKHLLR